MTDMLAGLGLPDQSVTPYPKGGILAEANRRGLGRVVVYGDSLRNVAASSDVWILRGIIAHELGHHLAGHPVGKKVLQAGNELEADVFLGFVLGRDTASLAESQAAIQAFAKVTGERTPQRLRAVQQGWCAANRLIPRHEPAEIQKSCAGVR
jgi:Zn-dependent protease with chaperone function